MASRLGLLASASIAGSIVGAMTACYRGAAPCGTRCADTAGCPDGFSCDGMVCVAPAGYSCPTGTIAVAIDNSPPAGAIDLDDFPVLVPIASTAAYYAVADPHTDLAFVDPSSGQELAFEVDHWDAGASAAVWVTIPHLAANTTKQIDMLIGPDVHGVENPTAVWKAYEAVWHLEQSAITSSANPAYTATAPSPTMPAKIGSGLRFAGGEAPIDVVAGGALLDGWPQFTLELWVLPAYQTVGDAAGEPGVLGNPGSAARGRLLANGPLTFQIDTGFTNHNEFLNVTTDVRVWTYVAYSFDGTVLTAYSNGALATHSQPPYSPPETLDAAGGAFAFGGNNTFVGGLDEVRISKRGLPAGWLAAQYRSMTGMMATLQ